jgi:putative PIN family toxin of toxin-antitoxin system
LRVFLDTNVLVSDFATRGLCADVLRHVLADHDLVLGEVVLVELRRALRDRIRLTKTIIDDIETFLRRSEVVPKPKQPADVNIRDPDDAWILASALDAKAEVLVTGDPDLLALGKRAPVPILTPREFWTTITRGRT